MNEIKVTFDGFKYQGNHIKYVSTFACDNELIENVSMCGAFTPDNKKTNVGIQIKLKDGGIKHFWQSMEDSEAMQKIFEDAEAYIDNLGK